MMVALYAAFWLYSIPSAAVTVGILALQTRGQAYEKALYRIVCTVIGVVASFVIAGLFPQTRELFLIGFAGWLGVCVYVGGLLDGNRAYGAVLAGYTVAVVAVMQIDLPQNIFLAGVNRGAAIVVGIAALALVSDVFAAPNLRTALFARLTAAHRRVRLRARHPARRGRSDPVGQSAARDHCSSSRHHRARRGIKRRIRAKRGSLERRRGAGRRGQRRAHWRRSPHDLAVLRRTLGEALADGLGEESRTLQLRLRQHADVGHPDPHDALFVRHAVELLVEDRRAQDAIEDPKPAAPLTPC